MTLEEHESKTLVVSSYVRWLDRCDRERETFLREHPSLSVVILPAPRRPRNRPKDGIPESIADFLTTLS